MNCMYKALICSWFSFRIEMDIAVIISYTLHVVGPGLLYKKPEV